MLESVASSYILRDILDGGYVYVDKIRHICVFLTPAFSILTLAQQTHGGFCQQRSARR